MLIVTGTKRSGTSMWMQILIAAGFPSFGEAFPVKWADTIKDANPSGFYESLLRTGIYYRTNPHPMSGAYFFPEQVERHVVKVFIPGLVRTDRAFIGRVVATMREWREYERSLGRLYAMEDDKRREKNPEAKDPVRIPAALEWWMENYALVRDIATRRYPVHVQSYDGLLQDAEGVIRKTLGWVGEGDADAAVAAVKPEHRTQKRPDSDSLEPEIAAVCDELYARVDEGRGLERSFIDLLNETNEKLVPRIKDAQHKARVDREERRRKGQPPVPADEGVVEEEPLEVPDDVPDEGF